jgi:hypothetical protein
MQAIKDRQVKYYLVKLISFLQDEENGLHSLMFKKREKSGEPIMSFCLSG